MPISTYLSDYEVDRFNDILEDKELKEILTEVNALPGNKWRIRKTEVERPRWCRKPQVYVFYTLFAHVYGHEWQIINFAPSEKTTLNTLAPKRDVLNFLTGYLSGWYAARPKGA